MIIPSIDLQGGQAVQLVGGKEKALDAGDPRPIAKRFSIAGEIAVVDLDAALGKGDNTSTIVDLCRMAPCRVGGGIRTVEKALEWLDVGATKVVLGTAATPEVLSQLPRERTIAALDALNGEVVIHGWRTNTGRRIEERMVELREHVGGFLVTFVETEGRMEGINLDRVKAVVEAAQGAEVTVAGGVTTAEDLAAIDKIGAFAQVGMALYTGRLPLADAIMAPLTSDRPDGLWPTIVSDERGQTLGLAYSNRESLTKAVELRKGVYHSRRRGLWIKGESSNATQDLIRIELDCDRDALHFIVRQHGPGFCHKDTFSCFGHARGLTQLERTLHSRKQTAPAGSYSARLFSDRELLAAKIAEEAGELNSAESREHTLAEAADVLFFTMARLARDGISLAEVEAELDRRALKVSRRPGNAKPMTETNSPTTDKGPSA
ncbi:MAG: phosphoribosyl-ATP diphosphatase [Polyangiaceae bacterium]|nr:phosphoribosyl-ATP diphosphatase [Polyangiaceae bacterium]